MRREIVRDGKGQLLLVTGIILAIALLSLAVISVKVTNVGHQMSEPVTSISGEVESVDSALGSSLQVVSNQMFRTSSLNQRTCIENAYGNVSNALRIHEARYGYAFSSTLLEISNTGNPYSVTILFSLSDGETDFTITKTYVVTFDY